MLTRTGHRDDRDLELTFAAGAGAPPGRRSGTEVLALSGFAPRPEASLRDEMVYDLGHASLRELRAKHAWLDRHRTLVVRINMMGKHSLTRALFEGYNAALPAGVPQLGFTDEERVFDLIEKDAQRLGGMPILLEQAASEAVFDDIPEMPRGMPGPMFAELYQRLRKGDRDKRLALAAALHNWRNHGASSIRADDL